MASEEPFAVTGSLKLFERVGTGGVEQPKTHAGFAGLCRNERFRHQH